MKLIYLYTIGIFIMFMSPSSYLCAQGVAENNQFFEAHPINQGENSLIL